MNAERHWTREPSYSVKRDLVRRWKQLPFLERGRTEQEHWIPLRWDGGDRMLSGKQSVVSPKWEDLNSTEGNVGWNLLRYSAPSYFWCFFRKQVSESLPLEGVNSHHTYSSLSHNSTLSIMYFNARSVFRKLDNLKLVCAIHHPDVICIVESWLDKEISDSELSLDGYNVSRVNRNRHGGGVLNEIYSCTQSCF